jgi:hypothetical protein
MCRIEFNFLSCFQEQQTCTLKTQPLSAGVPVWAYRPHSSSAGLLSTHTPLHFCVPEWISLERMCSLLFSASQSDQTAVMSICAATPSSRSKTTTGRNHVLLPPRLLLASEKRSALQNGRLRAKKHVFFHPCSQIKATRIA